MFPTTMTTTRTRARTATLRRKESRALPVISCFPIRSGGVELRQRVDRALDARVFNHDACSEGIFVEASSQGLSRDENRARERLGDGPGREGGDIVQRHWNFCLGGIAIHSIHVHSSRQCLQVSKREREKKQSSTLPEHGAERILLAAPNRPRPVRRPPELHRELERVLLTILAVSVVRLQLASLQRWLPCLAPTPRVCHPANPISLAMSTTQFGGPGSAFAFAAPTRPSRRTNSSSSFKDAGSTVTANTGPAPVQPPVAPSLGSFAPLGDREPSAASPNGTPAATADGTSPGGTGTAPGRSFSSILSPSLGAAANGGQLGGDGAGVNGRGKPFVYTREFLLSLYDEDKARKRPIELAMHDTATRDLPGAAEDSHKPWLLKEYRQGEKEVSRGSRSLDVRTSSLTPHPCWQLFANSIHPSNTRPSRLNRNDSPLSTNGGGASATLDLSTLGTLPRDRDRVLGSPSLRSPSIDKEALGGMLGGAAGRDRRTRERSLGPTSTMGIVGGVLGGIANGTTTNRKRDESVGSTASKDGVWQGGRWRRSAQEAEEAEAVRLNLIRAHTHSIDEHS